MIQQIKKPVQSRRSKAGNVSRLRNAGQGIVGDKATEDYVHDMKQGESNIMVS